MSKFIDEFGLARVWQNVKAYVQNSVSGSAGGGGTDEYSTEETRIGTWIDGKPIYRRVWKANFPESSNKTFKVSDTSAFNLDTVVTIRGVLQSYTTGPVRAPMPDYTASGATRVWVTINKELLISSVDSRTINQPCIVILEYTKTTD